MTTTSNIEQMFSLLDLWKVDGSSCMDDGIETSTSGCGDSLCCDGLSTSTGGTTRTSNNSSSTTSQTNNPHKHGRQRHSNGYDDDDDDPFLDAARVILEHARKFSQALCPLLLA